MQELLKPGIIFPDINIIPVINSLKNDSKLLLNSCERFKLFLKNTVTMNIIIPDNNAVIIF